jgi:hypothetical protein
MFLVCVLDEGEHSDFLACQRGGWNSLFLTWSEVAKNNTDCNFIFPADSTVEFLCAWGCLGVIPAIATRSQVHNGRTGFCHQQ